MKKSKIYTKTGDRGDTGLVGGSRIKKNDPRISLYGEVDELNSCIGFSISLLPDNFDKNVLQKIQSSLFDLGSNLACEKEKRLTLNLPKISEDLVSKLEAEIDKLDSSLLPLKNFILPGGDPAAASFHVCRTICRRLERSLVNFDEAFPEDVPASAMKYINRLSDYFFVLARFVNSLKKCEETLWMGK